ncbi:hypothetical protein AURDEDRAFT_124821 [Auricularia subglabra TFB-10046 SS5]|nr:hypothetical protein AURDEDRAFT_124821 [Auricularia subglabra TFB-10046 SS5]
MASFTCTFTGPLLEPSRAPPDATGLKGYNIYQSTILLQGSEIPVNIAHMTLQPRKAHGSIGRLTANANFNGSALLLVTNRLLGAPVQPIAASNGRFSHKLPRFVFSGVVTSDYEVHNAATQSISFDVTVKRHQVFPFGTVTFRCRTNRDGKRFALNEYPARGMSLNISGVLGGWSRYNTPLVDVHTLRFNYDGQLCQVHVTDTRNPFERAHWADGFALFELLANLSPPAFDVISYNAPPTRAVIRPYSVTRDPRLARAAVGPRTAASVPRASSAEPADADAPADSLKPPPTRDAANDADAATPCLPSPTVDLAASAAPPPSSPADDDLIAVTQAELAALVSGWQPGDSAPVRPLAESSATVARLLADLANMRSSNAGVKEASDNEAEVASICHALGEPVDSNAASALLALSQSSPPSPPPPSPTEASQAASYVDKTAPGGSSDVNTSPASNGDTASAGHGFISVQDVASEGGRFLRSDAPVTLSYRLSGSPLAFGTLIRLTGTFIYEAPNMQVGATKMEVVGHLGNNVDFRCSITLCFEGFVNGPIDLEEIADTSARADSDAPTTLMTFTCTVHGPAPSTVRCYLQKFELRKTLLPVIYEQHKVSIIGTACGHKDDVVFVNILSFAFCVYPPHVVKDAKVLYRPDDAGELETELVGVALPNYDPRVMPAPGSAAAAVPSGSNTTKAIAQSSTSSPQQSATPLPTFTPAPGTPTPAPSSPAPGTPTIDSPVRIEDAAAVGTVPTTPVAAAFGSPATDSVSSNPASPAKRMRLMSPDGVAPSVTFSDMLGNAPLQHGQMPSTDLGAAQALGSPFAYPSMSQGFENPLGGVGGVPATNMNYTQPVGALDHACDSPMSIGTAGSPFPVQDLEETSIGPFATSDFNVFNFLDTSMINVLPDDLVSAQWPLYEPFDSGHAPVADVVTGSSALGQAPLPDTSLDMETAQVAHEPPSSGPTDAVTAPTDTQAVTAMTPAPQLAFEQAEWNGEATTIDPRKIFEVRSGYVGP